MRKLDFYWDKEEWTKWDEEKKELVLREDAPEEAQESYKRFLQQKEMPGV